MHSVCQKGAIGGGFWQGAVAGLPCAPVPFDADQTFTSRLRLLLAGKEHFAREGYEQASTAGIAKAAGTSESQLVRYFGGKAGLLEAIFNESWAPLNDEVQRLIANAPHALEAVLGVVAAVTRALGADPELAVLFLFEGRRIRGGSEVVLSKGFVQFQELVRSLIRRGQQDGSLRAEFSDVAVTAAVMGAVEGMLRERLVAERAGRRAFAEREIRRVFAALLTGVAARPVELPGRDTR